ncbi:Lipin/Ned1/Smp2-domain-containing protein, partial [Pelagophyceae sp. CCMP2097]
LFVWRAGDAIVVCDIDGTITQTDVRGFVDSAGVCDFFERCVAPKAHVLYLTSRPLTLVTQTRGFVKSLRQPRTAAGASAAAMPRGPVLTSREGVLGALYCELVTQRPDVFKTAALRDVCAAFGDGARPFRAGFGNKDTDACAYARAGVRANAIFCID